MGLIAWYALQPDIAGAGALIGIVALGASLVPPWGQPRPRLKGGSVYFVCVYYGVLVVCANNRVLVSVLRMYGCSIFVVYVFLFLHLSV